MDWLRSMLFVGLSFCGIAECASEVTMDDKDKEFILSMLEDEEEVFCGHYE